MKKSLFSLLFLAVSFQLSAQQACSDPKNLEFDFWVGKWDVFNKRGMLVGKSEIIKIINGCGIEENWTSVGGKTAYVGKSINAFNTEKQKWEQYWFASDGSINYSGNGEYKDQAMRFTGSGKDAQGAFITNFIFFNDEPDKIRQYLERSYDGGKTYIPIFELTYKRKKE